MKKLFVACFVFFFYGVTYAQVDSRPFIFSLVPEASLPVGNLGKTNKVGLGGNLHAQFFLAEKLRLLANVGGVMYQGKTYKPDQYLEDTYPVVATLGLNSGLKYYLSDILFVVGNIGINQVRYGGKSKIGFAYAPVLGVELGGVDLLAKYNVIGVKPYDNGNIQTVGFCIGYRF